MNSTITIGCAKTLNYPEHFVTLPDYTAHAGQVVTVLRELGPDENDAEENGAMYEVIAADGWIGHAFEDELE